MRVDNVEVAHTAAVLVDIMFDLVSAHRGYYNGISAGEMYALMMSVTPIDVFMGLLVILVGTGQIEQSGLCYRLKRGK